MKASEEVKNPISYLYNMNKDGLTLYFFEVRSKNKFRTYNCYVLQELNLQCINDQLKTLGIKTNKQGLIKFGRCNDEICFIVAYVNNLSLDCLGFPIVKNFSLVE